MNNTAHLLHAIPQRPACTCAGGELCPADRWWQDEGRFQVARLGMTVENIVSSGGSRYARQQSHTAPPQVEGCPDAEWWGAIETWIHKNGCLPGSYSWEQFPVQRRPQVGKNSIYKYCGSMRAFYAACVTRGIATEAQRQDVLVRRGRRLRTETRSA